MSLEIGTILAPKYDIEVGHIIIIGFSRFHNADFVKVKNLRNGFRAAITLQEIKERYEVISKSKAGQVLFSDLKSKIPGPNVD